jgi:hypothetical protein
VHHVGSLYEYNTTFFYNCEIGYYVQSEAWAEVEATVQYKAYNTK